MSVSNPERIVTKQDLANFYGEILPYLGGSAAAGFTPVGTVISVMGVNAPANYLKCDGTVYNIVDYPELANYFYQQFGTKSKFGGNGTTTFAVPDLRGEFLRGTGTNGHTISIGGETVSCGNGENVGTHQNPTLVPNFQTPSGGDMFFSGYKSTSMYPIANYQESQIKAPDNTANNKSYVKTTRTQESTGGLIKYATRPTNTSVLYCIATKNIYLNPENDYSTDEKVIGTWIDGATVYQRTLSIPQSVNLTNSLTNVSLNVTVPNIKDFIDYKMHQYNGTNHYNPPFFRINYDNSNSELVVSDILYWGSNNFTIQAGTKITVKYTKTS